ncbi:MAG TPA: WXG100 family type VII secretion target [Aggregatilineales bacterium]|nr:WXG100 family type VII secretion target [Aggregatilineales bacterium]
MSTDEIQIQYDQLEKIIHRFEGLHDDHQQMTGQLKQAMESLEAGGMLGRAGSKFSEEMRHVALPSLHRLQAVFMSVGQTLAEVMRVIREGEEQAGNLFKQGGNTPTFISIKKGSDFGDYSDAYDTITDTLGKKGGLAGQVKFFDAASDVTDWNNLGLLEVSQFLPAGTPFVGGMSFKGIEYMKGISNHLYENVNRPHAERLLHATGDTLPSPSGNPNETFKTALEHDLRMVEVEQGEVERFINNGVKSGDLTASDVEHLKFGASHDWADEAITENANFTNLEYREAMGKAIIFEKHGMSKAQYLEYMRTQ